MDKSYDKKEPLVDNNTDIENYSAIRNNLVNAKVGLNDFEKIQLLGKGGVGHVYLVRLKNTEQYYAMKVLRKEDMIKYNKVKRVLVEQEILATANHPFIMNMYYSFQSNSQICFITQYCAGGELYQYIKSQPGGCLVEKHVKIYAAEILSALEYLHKNGFIYRDLKPENILIQDSGHIVLTDFDLAKQATNHIEIKEIRTHFTHKKQTVAEPTLVTNSFVGTEEYFAPEIIQGMGYNSCVDWWEFGILIYEMLFGITPFRGNDRNNTLEKIMSSKIVFPDHKHKKISKECKKLLKKLLEPNPKKRLGAVGGASDIKDAPFFKSVKWDKLDQQKPPFIPKITNKHDTRYFRIIKDDWDLDTIEVNPQELDDNNPWKSFKNDIIQRKKLKPKKKKRFGFF